MTTPEITVHDLAARGPEVRLIDVREQHEWDAERVPFAVNVPLATVPDHLELFDGSPTYVICRSGGRSAHACEYVGTHGLDAVNVSGGMLAWTAAGYQTAGGS